MEGLKLACVLILLYIQRTLQLSYVCSSDNSIAVSGLDATVDSVYAVNSVGTVCTTSSIASGIVTISGCVKDSYILFSYGTYDGMAANGIHGGQAISVDNITCNEISDTVHTVNNALAASIAFAAEQALAVTYTVTSSLSTSSATVGDPVTMTINYPSEYLLEVTSCTANPGTSFSDSGKISLINNYCSVENELIGDFSATGSGAASAIIDAFKFYDNTDVFIQCSVKVCPSSGACVTSCAGKRKRRSAAAATDYETKVGQVLHVVDPIAGAANIGTSLVLIILAAIASIL